MIKLWSHDIPLTVFHPLELPHLQQKYPTAFQEGNYWILPDVSTGVVVGHRTYDDLFRFCGISTRDIDWGRPDQWDKQQRQQDHNFPCHEYVWSYKTGTISGEPLHVPSYLKASLTSIIQQLYTSGGLSLSIRELRDSYDITCINSVVDIDSLISEGV